MPIDITTLDNSAATEKTFELVGRDRTASEWIDTTDTDADTDIRLYVKQQLLGKSRQGVPVRRSLVQVIAIGLSSAVINGNTQSQQEQVIANLTLTSPTQLSAVTATQRKDTLAFLASFLQDADNVNALIRGDT